MPTLTWLVWWTPEAGVKRYCKIDAPDLLTALFGACALSGFSYTELRGIKEIGE